MAGTGDLTPSLGRRRLGMRSGNGSVQTAKGEDADKPNVTRFGAVKVHAGLLSQAVDIKTYVVTNKTNAKELVSIVIAGYKTLCVDSAPFCLTLERISRRAGSSAHRAIKLHETAKPLEMQARYPRGDTRFALQLKPDCGVLTVSDKTVPEKCVSRSVFVSEQTTCSGIVDLLLKNNKLDAIHPEKYGVYEVEVNTKLYQELKPSHQPLIIQGQRLDAFEYYFEVRRKDSLSTQVPIRRNHSLEDLSGGHRKVLNYKELKKSLIPRRRQWRKSAEDLRKSGSQDSTLTKLKDSVGQLRQHIDNIQSRRLSLPGNSLLTMSDDSNEGHPHAGHARPLGRALSHESFQQEGPKGTGSLSQESMRHDDVNGYDTGSSLNESDGGSATVQKARGSRDSAYSSGRASHSSQHRNRRKKSAQRESGESSPEGHQSMTKSQSMMDLKTSAAASDHKGIARPKPTKIQSATIEHNAQRLNHARKALSGSDDNINSWSRMKQYDSVRRSQSGVAGRRANHGRLSLDGHGLGAFDPTEDIPSVSPTSSAGRSRTRRTLPQVPIAKGNNALEEHMRRISAVALVKARLDKQKRDTVEGWLGSVSQGSPAVEGLPDTNTDHQYNPSSTPVSSKGRQPEAEHPAASNLNRQSPASYKKPSTDFKPIRNGNDAVHNSSGASSQDALKRIISDLRDAASKPIDQSIHSDNRATPRSSGSSGYRERDPHPLNITYEKRRSSLECAFDSEPPVNQMNCASGGPEESSCSFRGLDAPVHEPEKKRNVMHHPSFHEIMKCCEILQIMITSNEMESYSKDFGIDLYDIEFSDEGSREVGNSSFRSPAGRRALIGRGKGAFQPVSSAPYYEPGQQQMSLVAITAIHEGSVALSSRLLQKGDYIIEVNGTLVTHDPAEKVKYLLANQEGPLQLVVARPKSARKQPDGKVLTTGERDCMIKDFEKLKIKYNSVRQDTENHLDTIADLRLDLQDRDRKIEELNATLGRNEEQINRLQVESQRREEKISEWKLEANDRNIEIARLKFDAQQREVKIEQLRKLLIQQSEVMQIQDNGYGDYDDLYEGEHVSAV